MPHSETAVPGHSKDRYASGDSSPSIAHPDADTTKEMKVIDEEEEEEEEEDGIRPSSPISIISEASEGKSQPHRNTPTLSRTTSIIPEAVVLERGDRRGLLARFALIPEVENPYHYTRNTKWVITVVVAICGAAAPMGSAIVMPTLIDIAHEFGASSTIANMSVAVYMLALAIFPLWWSSFSETTGRRTIYIISFLLFVVFAVLSAVSTNITMFIVFRTFSGGAAASVQAVGGGTIADIWQVKERGRALGLFYLGPLCGPLFAPIIGGALAQGLGWRSTQWFLVIYAGVTVLLVVFALPETLSSKTFSPAPLQQPSTEKGTTRPDLTRVSTRQSVQLKTKSTLFQLRRIFLDPLCVLTWLRFPSIALTVYYASITFGSLYILNISIQSTFSEAPYNFSTLIIGLLYIPNSLGYLIAALLGGRWIDTIMQREARKAGRYNDHGKLVFRPEDRMRENAWIAAALWPGALLWYGWSADKGVFWLVPMFANFFFGLGSMLIFGLSTTMLTEFLPKRASSGIAINNFVRNIFSFVGAVVAEPIIQAIGNGWLFTILGLWSLFSGFAVIWTMRKKGPAWREKMVETFGQ